MKTFTDAAINVTASLYVDSSTEKAYIAYGKNTFSGAESNFYVCWKQFSADEKEEKGDCVKQKRIVEDVVISGGYNGKNLLITYVARRKNGVKTCESYLKDGCKDIYIIESSDDGNTWSDAVPVPRGNLDDAFDRTLPEIFSVREKGRYFIFYNRREASHSYLAMVSKPQSSMIFSNERSVDGMAKSATNITATYSIVKNEMTMYLFFLLEGGDFYQMTTKDNGVTWTAKELLRQLTPGSTYSVTNSFNKSMVFTAVYSSNNVTLRWLEPGQKEWKRRSYMTVNPPKWYTMVATALPDDMTRFFFTGKITPGQFQTYIFNTETEMLKDQEGIPPITCYTHGEPMVLGSDNKKVRVLHTDENVLTYAIYHYRTEIA